MIVQGVVMRLVADRGFGFLRDDATEREYFFHRSQVRRMRYEDLTVGTPVTFEIVESSVKGPRAENVERA